MKLALNKRLLAFSLVLFVSMCVPEFAHASACLSEYTYGHHVYNHRSYDVLSSRVKKHISTTIYTVYDSDGRPMSEEHIRYSITDTYKRTWCCVCGAERDNKDTFSFTYETTETYLRYK